MNVHMYTCTHGEVCIIILPQGIALTHKEQTMVLALQSSVPLCYHMLKQAQPSKNILEEENSMEQATLQHQWVHAGSGHGKAHQLEL